MIVEILCYVAAIFFFLLCMKILLWLIGEAGFDFVGFFFACREKFKKLRQRKTDL